MIFKNPTIAPDDLPKVEQTALSKLAPDFKKAEYIGTSLLFIFFLVGAIVGFLNASPLLGHWRYLVFVLWGLAFTISLLLVKKRYELAGYALREHDVIYKHGVWWQTITAVPFNRMQHCEISQGPIQNAFGLSTLRIFTAGGVSSDLSMDGLEQEEAKRIKEFITRKISGQSAVDSSQLTVGTQEEITSTNEEIGDDRNVFLNSPSDINSGNTNNQQSTTNNPIAPDAPI